MIRLGINVPNFGPATTPASLRSWIEFAEETGFSLAMMSDHVAPTPDVTATYPVPFYDPFTTLSWLASFTTRLLLGTSVAIVPYRHPLLTARMTANLDQFTAGRFVLGDAWHPVNPGRLWLPRVGLPRLADAAACLGHPIPSLSPRITARLTPDDVAGPDRPLGVGSLAQIRDDLVLLDGLGADVVVLDTNPDHPDQRRPAADDWHTLQTIAACVDDLVTPVRPQGA